jgi:lipopolysaccharide transport system ATP-binding protein
MVAVQSLCNRTLWLDNGKVVKDGSPRDVVSNYLNISSSPMTEQIWNDIEKAPGNDEVRLHRVCVRPKEGSSGEPITVETPFVFEFEFWNLKPGVYLNLSLMITNKEGISVLNTFPVNEPIWMGRPFPKGLFRSVCYIPGNLMNDGTYRLQLFFVKDQNIILYHHQHLLVFYVVDVERQVKWYDKWEGVVRPALEWKTELVKTY